MSGSIGGPHHYLIETADLDEAIVMARQVPTQFGRVEVRPTRAVTRSANVPLEERGRLRIGIEPIGSLGQAVALVGVDEQFALDAA